MKEKELLFKAFGFFLINSFFDNDDSKIVSRRGREILSDENKMKQSEMLGCEHNVITIIDMDEGVCADCGVKMIRTWEPYSG